MCVLNTIHWKVWSTLFTWKSPKSTEEYWRKKRPTSIHDFRNVMKRYECCYHSYDSQMLIQYKIIDLNKNFWIKRYWLCEHFKITLSICSAMHIEGIGSQLSSNLNIINNEWIVHQKCSLLEASIYNYAKKLFKYSQFIKFTMKLFYFERLKKYPIWKLYFTKLTDKYSTATYNKQRQNKYIK